MKSFLRLCAASAVATTALLALPANGATITSTVAETGTTLGTKHNVVGDIGTFVFSDPAAHLSSISGLTLTLTLWDGDSGTGEFDFGDLTLGLDGIDTGLLLNGFNGGSTVTQTLSLSNLNQSLAASLYAELLDGSLLAQIFDADNDPGSAQAIVDPYANNKNVITLPAGYTAELQLVGAQTAPRLEAATVPEPASLALVGLGLAGLFGARRRQKA